VISSLGERLTAIPWRRIRWLLVLRWVAAACVLVVVTATRLVLLLSLPLVALYLGIAFLLLSNSLYTSWFKRLQSRSGWRDQARQVALLINLQIAVDLAVLAYLLHFSGGIGNPFVFFFVFHMVIASILLSGAEAYLQASWATVLFALLLLGDAFRFLPSYRVPFFVPPEVILGRPTYMLGLFGAFASAVFVAVYLTTSIANTLREREAELHRAVGDLVAANTKLEEKDREKSLYVQRVSHHIKGSLSAIQSCLRVVLDGLLGTVGQKAEEMIARAERRSLSLLRYANELLYLSSLRTEARLVGSEVRVVEVAERVAKELRAAFQDKEIELGVADESTGRAVRGDPELFAELIRQLLHNALKYTPRRGKVRVRLSLPESEQGLQLAVTDDGIGVRPQDLPHLFEDFFAADVPENRESTGAGLGLSIVRQIAMMHGGRVGAESRPGSGSTISCVFPSFDSETQGGS